MNERTPIPNSWWRRAGWLAFAALIMAGGLPAEEKRVRLRKATGVEKTMTHDGIERRYRIHVPKPLDAKEAAPLLVVFHGGGGNAAVASRMGFTELADREKIVVLYPEATDGNWNDGRTGELIVEKAGENDDVGFVTALIEKIKGEYEIDSTRIYATGFSNGGMMSHRMGIEKAEIFAAIAPGIGGIAKEMATPEKFRPSEPVSVMIIQGTEDPLVPYDGGKVAPKGLVGLKARKDRGEIVSTQKAMELWREANGINDIAKLSEVPDKDPDDGCALEMYSYPTGKNGARLVLVKMVGAGHTIPGGVQFLPERIIGKTCRDADGVELIWEFFKEIRKGSGR